MTCLFIPKPQSKQLNHSHPLDVNCERERKKGKSKEKKKDRKDAVVGAGREGGWRRKRKELISEPKVARCRAHWPWNWRKLKLLQNTPFWTRLLPQPQATPKHHQNPLLSWHKKGPDLRELACLDLRSLDVQVLICVHEKGAGNNALSSGGW